MFPEPVLQNWQVWLLGAVASLITIVLTWLIEKMLPGILRLFKVQAKIDLGRVVKTLLVGLVSLGLAYWWFPFGVPAWPVLMGDFPNKAAQIWTWIGNLLTALTPFVGAAMALYNVVIGYLTDPVRRSEAFKKLFAWLSDHKWTLAQTQ
jgi:hypothetical protein